MAPVEADLLNGLEALQQALDAQDVPRPHTAIVPASLERAVRADPGFKPGRVLIVRNGLRKIGALNGVSVWVPA